MSVFALLCLDRQEHIIKTVEVRLSLAFLLKAAPSPQGYDCRTGKTPDDRERDFKRSDLRANLYALWGFAQNAFSARRVAA